MVSPTSFSASTVSGAQRIAPPARLVGSLLVLAVAVFLVALATLSSAINWPASLDYPAEEMLPLLQAQAGAVTLGYSAYLLSALLVIPAAVLLRRLLDPTGASALLELATLFGVLSGVVKPLGILRWLTAMPELARSYLDPASGEAGRAAVGAVFQGLNAYAGGVGELLGVALCGGLWVLLLGVVLVRSGALPRWLGWSGVVVGALSLLPLLEIYGLDVGPLLSVSNASWYLWVLALGIVVLRRNGATLREAGRS